MRRMAQETRQLAKYAAALRYEDLPGPVVQRAKDAIADTIAAIAFGADLPWSRIIVDYARRRGAGGKSRIFAPGGARLQAPMAAFANGALAHAFEMDNLTWPNTGVHPGATMCMPALAVAQERGIGGRELIAALVAGAEVMIRIGRATKHNNEGRGFHAPGTTGPFGGAVAVGRLLKFDAETMTNALGIAGSLSCGLLEFARSGTGAMVKRLHLGRAAESGVLAASLAEARLHRAAERAGRAVRLPQRLLRRERRRGADARARRGMGDAPHHAQALSRSTSPRTPRCRRSRTCAREHGYDRRRRRLDPHRRQPEDGDGQQHPGADRPDDGAIFAAVLRGAGALPRCARSGLVQRQIVQRSGDPRAGAAGDDLGRRRGQARPQHRLDRHGDAQGWPRADAAASTASRARRSSRSTAPRCARNSCC